jgi:hypothetical protein
LGRAAFFAGSARLFWIIRKISFVVVFALRLAAFAACSRVSSRISEPSHKVLSLILLNYFRFSRKKNPFMIGIKFL